MNSKWDRNLTQPFVVCFKAPSRSSSHPRLGLLKVCPDSGWFGVCRQLYRHCSETLRLIALLWLGLVKPSTFTEAYEREQYGRTKWALPSRFSDLHVVCISNFSNTFNVPPPPPPSVALFFVNYLTVLLSDDFMKDRMKWMRVFMNCTIWGISKDAACVYLKANCRLSFRRTEERQNLSQ
jgi:hypothetical protein